MLRHMGDGERFEGDTSSQWRYSAKCFTFRLNLIQQFDDAPPMSRSQYQIRFRLRKESFSFLLGEAAAEHQQAVWMLTTNPTGQLEGLSVPGTGHRTCVYEINIRGV